MSDTDRVSDVLPLDRLRAVVGGAHMTAPDITAALPMAAVDAGRDAALNLAEVDDLEDYDVERIVYCALAAAFPHLTVTADLLAALDRIARAVEALGEDDLRLCDWLGYYGKGVDCLSFAGAPNLCNVCSAREPIIAARAILTGNTP